MAAYLLSETSGGAWCPPTLERDGPYGQGSIQLFVDADFEEHYFTLRERPEHRAALARLCAFDLVANNADRKSGHCLLGRDGHLYAIDNGLCFHAESKLRTVVWDLAGEPIPAEIRTAARRLVAQSLPEGLARLLGPDERAALLARARALGAAEQFPEDATGMRYPWPLV